MSITSKFNFIGEPIIPRPKDSEHSNFYKRWNGGRDGHTEMVRINFGVKDGPSNSAFVELFGMVRDPIKTMDLDNNKIEVPWADRKTEEALKLVPYYKKFIADLGPEYGGRQEFITESDMVQYLAKHLPDYKGKIFVTGQWNKNAYNGKITDRFVIKDVYGVEADRKSKLELTMDLFYNADSVDVSSVKGKQRNLRRWIRAAVC